MKEEQHWIITFFGGLFVRVESDDALKFKIWRFPCPDILESTDSALAPHILCVGKNRESGPGE